MKANRDFLKAYSWAVRDREGTDMKRGMPVPPAEKPLPEQAGMIELVPDANLETGSMPLIDTIRKRQSRRKFSMDPLTLEELSFLLWTSQGLRDTDAGRNHTKRTVPSAGGRHPFETYLIINRVSGLSAGLYRYLPGKHGLCLLRQDPSLADKVVEGTRGQAFVGQGAVVFIWTAVPYRAEYRFSLVAHKMIAIDAGHVCQNLYLAAESIGAGACAIAAYDQDKMDALLGVDGEEEFVIYAAPVGKI
jgi:SagB-type dehydrogenase family enzyme